MELRIPDTPLSISSSTCITMLEEVLMDKVDKRVSFSQIFFRKGLTVNICGSEKKQDALCHYESNPYGRNEKLEIVSIDPYCIELWKCIRTLKCLLK